MKIASHQERTIVLLLGGFVLGILALFAMACGDPSTDVDDIEHEPAAEVDRIDQASWCFGFPVRIMGFPVNQGVWKGDTAGQWMAAPFWTSACQPTGTVFGYGQEDGNINLMQDVGWKPSTCWTWKGATSGVVCNNQSFQCPASACLTEPVVWQNSIGGTINWGWSRWSAISTTLSEAPGNHNIWPNPTTQCSTTVATPEFTPNSTGGTLLNCKYPMPTYTLRQN